MTIGLEVTRFLWPSSDQDEYPIIFEVTPGESFRSVARSLKDMNVIGNAEYFVLLGRLTGSANKIRVGEYQLSPSMPPLKVLEVLSSGRSVEYSLTIPEGTNMYEIAAMMERVGLGTRDEVLAQMTDPGLIESLLGEKLPSLEGYLFPETYFFTKFTRPQAILEKMVQNFLRVYNQDVQPLIRGNEMSRHQIVTLASIVEKETGVPSERGLVASVFHNRLKKRMRLQTDPTVLYGILDQTKAMRMNITRNDLRTPTRYNTYTMSGLPYGPISNPGRESLIATVQPEESPYLYFVSRNDGTHVFTETYEKHQQAVRAYQLNPEARRGKSWRDFSAKGNESE